MDILIPLGRGSRWSDNELRYCLRSVEKHLIGYSHIFLVGECPLWIDRDTVIHIPAEDIEGFGFRDYNIYQKIMAGCEHSLITDNFLFMNDDHFLLQNFTVQDFPYYHQGPLIDAIDSIGDVPYRKVLWNTYAHLKKEIEDPLNFDVHCPIRYNRNLLKLCFDMEWPNYGFAIKSIYCNKIGITGERVTDLKFRTSQSRSEIMRELEGKPFFSIGDKCLKGDMKQVLQEFYPSKSKFEI